jgi:hypothetical protein
VKEVKKAPSTVSTYTTKLIHDGIVIISYKNSEKIFKINPKIHDQIIYAMNISV